MRERKLACGPCDMRKNILGKTINKSTKETYEEHFASYSGFGVLIKPGRVGRILENCRTSVGA